MIIQIPYLYQVQFLPTKKHRNIRTASQTANVNVTIPELAKNEFPVAFQEKRYSSVCVDPRSEKDRRKSQYKAILVEYRAYNKKLFTLHRYSYGAVVSENGVPAEHIDEIVDLVRKDNKFRYIHSNRLEGNGLFTKNSVIKTENKETEKALIQKEAKNIVIFEGNIWHEAQEPMYEIITFGLGHNHGGTGFFVTNHYNDNISAKNYFNALEYEKAKEYFRKVALGRGDTDSIGQEEKMEIKVLMPEMVKRNPLKDHGNGNPIINGFEDIISGSPDALTAGLLVMASATNTI